MFYGELNKKYRSESKKMKKELETANAVADATLKGMEEVKAETRSEVEKAKAKVGKANKIRQKEKKMHLLEIKKMKAENAKCRQMVISENSLKFIKSENNGKKLKACHFVHI